MNQERRGDNLLKIWTIIVVYVSVALAGPLYYGLNLKGFVAMAAWSYLYAAGVHAYAKRDRRSV